MNLKYPFTPLVQAMLACVSLSSSTLVLAQSITPVDVTQSDIATDNETRSPTEAPTQTSTAKKNYAEMYRLGEDFFHEHYKPLSSKSSSSTPTLSINQNLGNAEQDVNHETNQNISSLVSTSATKNANAAQGIKKLWDYVINPNPLPYCTGQWQMPAVDSEYFDTEQRASSDLRASTSVITADQGYYNPHGRSFIEGNVVIEQQGRRITADRVELDESQTYAKAQGKVRLQQNGLLSQSEQVEYNLKQQTGNLQNSFYIHQPRQAHGYAGEIQRPNQNTVVLKNSSYTSCAPSVRPAWHIQASEITLNQDTGRGISKNARLYIKNVPVLNIPYFNFPIDDRRTTGFLTPSFGYTNDGGIQVAAPYYINLAPNYDLTITPRYLNQRGLMADAKFRYLTEHYGQGYVSTGYLPSDRHYAKQDRKSLHFEHFWQISPNLKSRIDYNYVSDKDYFTDLGNTPTSSDSVYQPRSLIVNYDSPNITGFNAEFRVQDFQTIDKSIVDANRPYARLPQLLLNYTGGNILGLNYQLHSDLAYFKKPIRDNSALERSGMRVYNQANVSYNHQKAGYYIQPTLGLRSLFLAFDRDSKISQGLSIHENVTRSVILPQFTLDSGLTFEKQGDYLQTLKPRLFYAYTPYREQNDFANFDSHYTTIGYDQLFSPYRFYGHDRIEDNNFASLGLSYSLYNPEGLEKIKASLGQSYYFSQRKVQLDNQLSHSSIYRQRTSGSVLSLSSQYSDHLWLNSHLAWLGNGKNALSQVGGYYQDPKGRLYQASYLQRRHIEELGQQAYRQLSTSMIQPIHNNWRILGHVQYDLKQQASREVLVGLNYESCCWGLSVYARRYYNDLDNIQTAKANRAIMAEFSLKGLGGLTGRLSSLLEQRILGYQRPAQTWNSF